jgi:UDP-glucuronate decarboxylase
MSTILVTGGAGFIASEIAIKLAQNPENHVVVIDNLLTGSTKKLPLDSYDNLHFIKCDVNIFEDVAGVFYAYNFDYVFHYAALVGVQRTLRNPVSLMISRESRTS